ncbi:hypothetical protein EG329_004970 [Mollisiaceae sp. DMI_Dod_QoI]|nr:hypothetical protein EG329_004970 [Helotiales sp. DMI_Dod_QoI]
MSFLLRTLPRQSTRVVFSPAPRAFSTSFVQQKTATEAVKDTVKGTVKTVDRAVSDKLVDGIEIGRMSFLHQLSTIPHPHNCHPFSHPIPLPPLLPTPHISPNPSPHHQKETQTNPTLFLTPETAAQKAKEVAGMSSSEAKGKASELSGEAKGKASEVAGEARGKKEELKGKL